MPPIERPRILTGDQPTGRLHIGHWVGSLENRIRRQADHDCYFLIANLHAFTTRADQPGAIRRDTLEIVKDWLAAGIDPERATLVQQSAIPAIAELTWLLAMLLPVNRVLRNPTLRAELDAKDLGDTYSFGFPLYTVGQCADILAFRAQLVPVGADQAAHIEMCREGWGGRAVPARRKRGELPRPRDPGAAEDHLVVPGVRRAFARSARCDHCDILRRSGRFRTAAYAVE